MTGVGATQSPPLRIALWAPGGAGLHYHGPGTNAYRLYSGLDPRRGVVDLFHASASQEKTSSVFSCVTQVSTPSTGIAVRSARIVAEGVRRSGDMAARYDVFHGMSGFWQTVGPACAMERAGLPTVCKITGDGSETVSPKGLRGAAHAARVRAMRRVSAFVAISDKIADQLVAAGIAEDRIWRIPNGVDVDIFHPADRVSDGRRQALILFVGAVVRRKRPHLALEALARVVSQVDAKLMIAGPANDQQYLLELRALVSALNLDERVEWLGKVDDMPTLYRSVDVVCLPSEGEGMANAILEAMSSGVPFVVTETSGMPELAASGGGLLADGGPRPLADAIVQALDQRGPMGAAGRQAAVNRYSTSAVLDAHLGRFQDLVESRGRAS